MTAISARLETAPGSPESFAKRHAGWRRMFGRRARSDDAQVLRATNDVGILLGFFDAEDAEDVLL